MKYAGFESIHDAAIYRHNHGGWLWVDDYGNAAWFDAATYTPSHIFAHPIVINRSGSLVSDDRYLRRFSVVQS